MAEDRHSKAEDAQLLTDPDEKARELARMMSGGVTDKAVARAQELLEEAARPVR